jgi:H+/Cl- antiporter ClcA
MYNRPECHTDAAVTRDEKMRVSHSCLRTRNEIIPSSCRKVLVRRSTITCTCSWSMKPLILCLLSGLITCRAFLRLPPLFHEHAIRFSDSRPFPTQTTFTHSFIRVGSAWKNSLIFLPKPRHLYSLESNGREVEVLGTNGDSRDTKIHQTDEADMEQTIPISRNNNSVTKLQYAAYDMTCAGIVGVVTGIVVAYFKLSIESVRMLTYSLDILDSLHNEVGAVFIPVVGGLVVGLILLTGSLSPGLRGTVSQVESIAVTDKDDTETKDILTRLRQQIPLLRKASAAVSTLGTGCSLGPEGPCVELGMGIARSCIDLYGRRPIPQTQNDLCADEPMNRALWNRILLSCGAAAGVSAGFDAPVAGVFFALEVMQSAFSDAIKDRNRQIRSKDNDMKYGQSNEVFDDTNLLPSAEGLFSSASTLTPVLLSSVLSALCARGILGDHLTFNVAKFYALSSSPLLELPIYLLLGAICGCVAFVFSQSAKLSRSFFEGEIGTNSSRTMMQSISPTIKPMLGGLFCGASALFYPQVLFFGYETLNSILSNTAYIPTSTLLSLLFVKAGATAISIGSGLVGGTLAPALFLGGVTGASFHNVMTDFYHAVVMYTGDFSVSFAIADLPSYAMVGSASVLAALFRAPLTASLLLFELSRDYDVILPIIASAGIGCVVADLLEDSLVMNQQEETAELADSAAQKQRRDKDSASWGDLSDKIGPNEESKQGEHRLPQEAKDR